VFDWDAGLSLSINYFFVGSRSFLMFENWLEISEEKAESSFINDPYKSIIIQGN
jgi:hypothetical protein